MRSFSVAILDLYKGVPNEGMRCIINSIATFGKKHNISTSYEVFDVRANLEIPVISDFDAFISSGGPGSPLLENTPWEAAYFDFISNLENFNSNNQVPKPLFAICHSFQLLFQYFQLGNITKRKSTAFGVMPLVLNKNGKNEVLFEDLDEPFWVVDSRDYQAIEPNHENFEKLGAKILCLEKNRPNVPLERAIMAIRFNNYMIGTQFHPEADGEGMHRLFLQDEKKSAVINTYGETKYYSMLDSLNDPEKIEKTENTILPAFYKFSFSLQYKSLES
jgi:homoserine O-succinyltransferase/O-acetyltransferase